MYVKALVEKWLTRRIPNPEIVGSSPTGGVLSFFSFLDFARSGVVFVAVSCFLERGRGRGSGAFMLVLKF